MDRPEAGPKVGMVPPPELELDLAVEFALDAEDLQLPDQNLPEDLQVGPELGRFQNFLLFR